MNEIIVKNLSKSFGEKTVLKDVNFTLPYGGTLQLTGESGIGKTTLLRIIAGLEKPDFGEIIGVSGKDVSFLFQEDRLFPEISALSNVTLVMKGKNKKEKARALLLDLNLTEKDINLRPSELSGGMCRRVAIARALAYDKPVLVLDEALRGLDAENAQAVTEVIERESIGKTVIFVSHGEPPTNRSFDVLAL